MGNPEIARSGKTDIDPDHVETGLQGQKAPKTGGETGPIPADNMPGHHPPKEQDKPDLDAFAAKLGTDPEAPGATSARKGPATRKPAARPTPSTAAKSTPPKSAPAQAGDQPASPKKTATAAKPGPAPAPVTAQSASATAEAQKANNPAPPTRPATVLAPSAEEAAHVSAPQPEPADDHESRLTTLVLLPLRETVKRLEQLDRTLTKRLEQRRRSA